MGKHEKELSGSDPATTNNRMEMIAVVQALKALIEPCEVTLCTDSRYVIDGMTKWGLIVGISGLIVAGLYYFLKQEMSVGLIDESGHTSVISFKRSVIEGQKLGQEQAAYASSIIQWACDNSRRSSHG